MDKTVGVKNQSFYENTVDKINSQISILSEKTRLIQNKRPVPENLQPADSQAQTPVGMMLMGILERLESLNNDIA